MLQDSIDQIVQGFLFGDRDKKRQDVDLYQETFGLNEIQSEAVRCGTVVPDWVLEFDRNNLVELLEESLSLERMEELKSGANPRLKSGRATERFDFCRSSNYSLSGIAQSFMASFFR